MAEYIWILTALGVVPKKDLILRCCFIHLKNNSTPSDIYRAEQSHGP
jgi:hypothetical protein